MKSLFKARHPTSHIAATEFVDNVWDDAGTIKTAFPKERRHRDEVYDWGQRWHSVGASIKKLKRGSPTYERYTQDILERAKRTVTQSRERVAESKKLQDASGELLEEILRRRKSA